MLLSILFYHIFFILSVTISYIGSKWLFVNSIKLNFAYLSLFSFFIIIIVSSIRDYVGSDYDHYTNTYNLIASGNSIITEPGYYFLNYIFKDFNNGHRFVFSISAIITFIPLFIRFKEEELLPHGITFLFTFGYIFMSYNLVMQAIAISTFLFSLKFVYKRKPYHYFGFLLIAFLFHTSSLFLFPFYWILRIRINKSLSVILIVLAVSGYFLDIYKFTYKLVVLILPAYAELFFEFEDKIEGIGTTFLLTIILALFTISQAHYLFSSIRTRVYFNTFLFGVLVSILFFNSDYITRLSYYQFYAIILLIPSLLKKIEDPLKKEFVFWGYFFLSITWWMRLLFYNGFGCLPYQTFLF